MLKNVNFTGEDEMAFIIPMKIRLLILLFTVLAYDGYAQYEFLLDKKDVWHRNMAFDSIRQVFIKCEDTCVAKEISLIKTLADKYDNPVLDLEADYIRLYCKKTRGSTGDIAMISGLHEVIKKSKVEGITDLEERSTKTLADYYWTTIQNYELAFEYYLKADYLLQQLDPETFPFWKQHYNDIARAFYEFRDYHTAIIYLKKSHRSSINRLNWKSHWTALNSLGLSYLEINRSDSAMYYFKKSLETPFLPNDNLRYFIARGNIGRVYHLQNKHVAAIPLINNKMKNALKYKDYGAATSAAIDLTSIYTALDDFTTAESYFKRAEKHIKLADWERLYIDYYKTGKKLFYKKKQFELAHQYQDSMNMAYRAVFDKYDALFLLRAQQKVDRQILEAETEENNQQRKRSTAIVLLLSGLVLMIVLTSVLVNLYTHRKHNIHQQQKDQEIRKAQMALENLNERMSDKDLLIEQWKSLNSIKEKARIIEELHQKKILTLDDWIDFKRNFERIYPDYYTKVMAIDKITPSEARLLFLSKFDLTSSEIAVLLGVSPQSVRITWHRFKKKQRLAKDYTVHKFVKTLNK